MNIFRRLVRQSCSLRSITLTAHIKYYSSNPIDFPDMGPPIPEYQSKTGESDEILRNRLTYQSRKRGMSENGLLLGNFASRFLQNFSRDELEQFDKLINKPSNDWDLYYWIMDKRETPKEYDTPVMNLLKDFSKNKEMESRYRQPDLRSDEKS